MKVWILSLLFILSFKAFAQIGPLPCGAVSSITTWRQDFAYSIGQVVILDGVTYQSLTNSNLNQNPCTYQGSQWNNVIAAGLSPVQSVTTIGTNGPATLSLNGVLNIPQYIPTTGILPNGTQAVTQTTGDATNKVATDAFVLANAGAGPSIPATTNVLIGSGTAGLAAVGSPGVDYMAAVTAPGYGYCPVSTGAGGTYAAQGCLLQFGSNSVQFVQQETTNANWTTLGINNLNNIYYPEGFTGGGYYGVGLAPIAWTGSTGNVGMGQVVTYSGGNYIAVQANNGTVTPGTNVYFWMPVPQAVASTLTDVAYYTAEAYKHYAHVSPTLRLGSGFYNTALGLQDLIDGNSYDDIFSVNIEGCGVDCSVLNYTGTAAVPVIQRVGYAANFAYLQIEDLTVQGNFIASSDMDLDYLNQSVLRNLYLTGVAVGSDHFAEIGSTGGNDFQAFMENVAISSGLNAQPNAVQATANIVGGSVTSYTINNSGSPYYSNACGGGYTCYVALLGYQGGSAAQPCTVMPTGQVVTISAGGVTSITEGTNTGGSGCVGPIDVQVYQAFPVNYGIVWNASDSTVKDVTIYSGVLAGFENNGGGSTVFLHLHPSVIPVGIVNNNAGQDYLGTELDTMFIQGFNFQEPFADQSVSVQGTISYYAWELNGSTPYYFSSSTDQVNISNSGSMCGTGLAGNTDYHEFVTQSGPILSPSDYLTKAPTGLVVAGNDLSCSGNSSIGDFIPTLTVNTLLAGGIVDGRAPVTITTATTASLGGTYSSGYTINHEATAGAAVTYTLPVAGPGRQYCVKNGNNGSASDTGVLTLQTSGTGQSIVYNGTAGASDGYFVSSGAAGDSACVVGISSTQWEAYVSNGSWAIH